MGRGRVMSIRLIQGEQMRADAVYLCICVCARAERQMTIAHNDKKLLDIITANFMPENKAESDSAQEKRVKQILKKIVARKIFVRNKYCLFIERHSPLIA